MQPMDAKGLKVPPSYPPKTPPPPKKPVERPRPETLAGLPLPGLQTWHLATRTRPRMAVRNRRVYNFTTMSDRWAASKIGGRLIEAVRGWGYRMDEEAVKGVARLLVEAAVADEGKRISVHVADQDAMVLVVVLSHRAGFAPDGNDLARIAGITVTSSCGTDSAPDGRRVWALMDTRVTASSVAQP
ncbi:hypothetical protein AB0G85_35915 [Streptomyces sioyaensis]|uniref:hypothetical protein n=1 Tax=Streptomyces sioyaensis TaxID=67364 RepID=UPI0033E06041